MAINLRQIEVFRAIMMTGSISSAARLLHVSAPAVSRMLSYMESRIEFPLFDRVKGRLCATPEARQLYHETEHVHLGVQRVNVLAQDLAGKKGGLLSVVSSPSVGQAILPQAVASFCAAHKDVRVAFRLFTFAQLTQRMLDRQADLGITVQPTDHANLLVTPIARGEMFLICPRDSTLAKHRKLKLSQLRSHTLISYSRDTPFGIRVEQFYRAKKEPLKVSIEVGSPHNACAMVKLGAGVAIVDAFSVRGWSTMDFAMIPLDGAPEIVAHLVHPRSEPLSQVAVSFVKVLRQTLIEQSFEIIE